MRHEFAYIVTNHPLPAGLQTRYTGLFWYTIGSVFRILVTAHAPFASATVETARAILGDRIPVFAVDLLLDESPENNQRRFTEVLDDLLADGEVLMLVDFLGGSPSNLALVHMEKTGLEIIAGFNLPLLFKAVTMARDHLSLREAVPELVVYGAAKIQSAASLLGE